MDPLAKNLGPGPGRRRPGCWTWAGGPEHCQARLPKESLASLFAVSKSTEFCLLLGRACAGSLCTGSHAPAGSHAREAVRRPEAMRGKPCAGRKPCAGSRAPAGSHARQAVRGKPGAGGRAPGSHAPAGSHAREAVRAPEAVAVRRKSCAGSRVPSAVRWQLCAESRARESVRRKRSRPCAESRAQKNMRRKHCARSAWRRKRLPCNHHRMFLKVTWLTSPELLKLLKGSST